MSGDIMKSKGLTGKALGFLEVVLVVVGLSALVYGIFSDNTELFEKPPSYNEGYLVDAKGYHDCIAMWQVTNKTVMAPVTPDVEWTCSMKAKVYPK